MIDKGINAKKIDLSGVSFPTNDVSTCALIYTAVRNTYGFPLYLTNFKINDEKRDSVLVNPIIEEDKTIINLNDCHLIVTPTDISVGKGVYGTFLESIVDKDGNKRFVEGDITMKTITGITQTYGKWSLSGTHLMIVIAANVANETTLPVTTIYATFTLPSFIYNKIKPIYTYWVDRKEYDLYDPSNGSAQTGSVALRKDGVSGTLSIVTIITPLTITNDSSFRIQFDLLIDDEYDE